MFINDSSQWHEDGSQSNIIHGFFHGDFLHSFRHCPALHLSHAANVVEAANMAKMFRAEGAREAVVVKVYVKEADEAEFVAFVMTSNSAACGRSGRYFFRLLWLMLVMASIGINL
uniref:Uncharacterized protein n=1 Tax=Glossina brevipalpis TaxID=37001 RepID=A0A1A9WW44_9MUSC